MSKTTITLPSFGLTDANADRILFWDDSAGNIAQLTASTNLTISGTNVTASGGKVLQYVAATPTIGETSSTSGTLAVGGGGINLAITPSSSSNKILIAFHSILAAQEDNGVFVDIQRAIDGGATTNGIANAESGSASQGLGGFGSAANAGTWYGMVGQFFVDDPSTTSEITYKPMFARWFGSGTVYMGNNASICSGYAMELET